MKRKQITAILLGAGNRGAEAYASYALQNPVELKFVAVAEPRKERREIILQYSCRIRNKNTGICCITIC